MLAGLDILVAALHSRKVLGLLERHRDQRRGHRRLGVESSRPAEAEIYGLLLPQSMLTRLSIKSDRVAVVQKIQTQFNRLSGSILVFA